MARIPNRKRKQKQSSPSIVPYAIQWLEKRKKTIPVALHKSDCDGALSPTSIVDIPRVLSLLPSLRERERRALVRHLEKCMNSNANEGSLKETELASSDGEYDDDRPGDVHRLQSLWPARVEFSNDYRWECRGDRAVPDAAKRQCRPPGDLTRRRSSRPSRRVYFKPITDPDHPAHQDPVQCGLYCALEHAPPGTWLLDYVGHVTLGEHQDARSDYVSDFGEKGELSCDAHSYGNEARFLNDFRNTGKHPNVEFKLRRDRRGELRQGVYVKSRKEAKEAGFDGVRRDDELLVSYGKSYWRSRVGNLTDFVWRLPGHPMPDGGKPITGR